MRTAHLKTAVLLSLVCFTTSAAARKNYRYVHCEVNWILENITLFATSHLMHFIMKTTQSFLSKAVYVSLLTVKNNRATSCCKNL